MVIKSEMHSVKINKYKDKMVKDICKILVKAILDAENRARFS